MQNIDFLLSAEPWVEYRTRLDLLESDKNDALVKAAGEAMSAHPLVRSLINELTNWPDKVVNSHKSAGMLYHKLVFLADLGIVIEDKSINEIICKVMEHQAEEGPFQLPMNIPTHFGGTGKDQWAWALCDAPLLLYSLAKMGLADQQYVRKGVEYLLTLARDNGWPCAVARELGKFRGPGRKSDPCPYANLVMLKLLTLFKDGTGGKEAKAGVECLLGLWEKSRDLHPYMFFMGTDFRKLKAPYIWYDILHVVEVLSQYDSARSDSRFMEMVDLVNLKADEEGLFTPQSVWKAWTGWDFAQKKKPSGWLTYLVYRINKRLQPLST